MPSYFAMLKPSLTIFSTIRPQFFLKISMLPCSINLFGIISGGVAKVSIPIEFPIVSILILFFAHAVERFNRHVREGENFAHSMILLEQARNVKYKSFLAPGAQIEYTVEAKAIEENIVVNGTFAGAEIYSQAGSVNAVGGIFGFYLDACLFAGLGRGSDSKAAAPVAVPVEFGAGCIFIVVVVLDFR